MENKSTWYSGILAFGNQMWWGLKAVYWIGLLIVLIVGSFYLLFMRKPKIRKPKRR